MTNYSTIEKAVQSIFAAGDTRGLIDPMYHAAKAGDFFKLVKKREDVDAMLSYYIVLNRIDANATETAARFLGDIPMLGKVSAKGQKIQGMGNYTADLFSILLHYMENPDGINAKSRHEQLNKPYLQRMQQEKQNEIETLGPQAVMHFMEFMHNVVPLENASEFLATQKEISDFAMNRSGDRKQMHEDFWNYFTGLEVLSKDDSTFVGRKIALKLHSAALPILSIYGTDTLSTVSSLILKYENMREPWFANKIIDTLYAFGRKETRRRCNIKRCGPVAKRIQTRYSADPAIP